MGIDWMGTKEYETDVRGYFPCCPLCGSKDIQVHITAGGRDSLSCEGCGAKWHIHVGLTGLSWAELDLQAEDGRGEELLGKRLDKKEWLDRARKARRKFPHAKEDSRGETAKEKEIIKEKQVIVKVRCAHCRHLYDETLDKCPNCGASG